MMPTDDADDVPPVAINLEGYRVRDPGVVALPKYHCLTGSTKTSFMPGALNQAFTEFPLHDHMYIKKFEELTTIAPPSACNVRGVIHSIVSTGTTAKGQGTLAVKIQDARGNV